MCQRHTCSQGWTSQFGCDSCGCSSQIITSMRFFLRGQSLCLALFQVVVVWFTPVWMVLQKELGFISFPKPFSPCCPRTERFGEGDKFQFHFSRAGLKIEALYFLSLCRCLRLSICLSRLWLIYFFNVLTT